MGLLSMIIRIIERIIAFFIGADDKKLYGLDHAILHVEAPPRNMWMNMGHWKHTKSFPEACEALLEQVLITAGLLNEDKTPIACSSPGGQERAIKLVDVGIGCGDQSLYLTSRLSKSVSSKTQESEPLFDSYVGVTIAKSQADFARERLLKNPSSTTTTPNAQIFAANAADPTSWNPELTKATTKTTTIKEDPTTQTWLLALDTLYHFTPSRKPLLKHAHQDLRASFMAFDLLLADTPSFWDKLRMRAICLVAGMPFSNLLTRKGYEDMLVEVGYERGMVEMRDVSGDVFAGIARYIREKDAELGRFGMGVGKFRGPAKVFDWWARSGVIRGFVVVARR